jgi:hypothetical protein
VDLKVPVRSTVIKPLSSLNFIPLTRSLDLYSEFNSPPTYSELIENSCCSAILTSLATSPVLSTPELTGIAESPQIGPPVPTWIRYIEGLPLEAEGIAGDWFAANVGKLVGVAVGVSLGTGVSVAVAVGGSGVSVGEAVGEAVWVAVEVGVSVGGTRVAVGGAAVSVGTAVGSGVDAEQADKRIIKNSNSIAFTSWFVLIT